MAYVRQQDIVDQKKLSELSVALIGCGAIGSHTALTLTKMGIRKFSLWDPDSVELHNLANQFFTRDAIGKPKVEATKAECLRHAVDTVDFDIHTIKYDGRPLDYDCIIAVTDNIEGRALAFKQAKENFVTSLYIDGRMTAEMVRIFSFPPKNYDFQTLYYTDYVEGVVNQEGPCTAKAICYNVGMAASLITSYVKKYIMAEPIPFEFTFHFKDMEQVKSK
jgi:hypothetical protein